MDFSIGYSEGGFPKTLRPCSHLVSTSILSDSVTSGQLWVQVWTPPKTTFAAGPSCRCLSRHTIELVTAILPDSFNKLCDFKSWCVTTNLTDFEKTTTANIKSSKPYCRFGIKCKCNTLSCCLHLNTCSDTILTNFIINTTFIREDKVLLAVNMSNLEVEEVTSIGNFGTCG